MDLSNSNSKTKEDILEFDEEDEWQDLEEDIKLSIEEQKNIDPMITLIKCSYSIIKKIADSMNLLNSIAVCSIFVFFLIYSIKLLFLISIILKIFNFIHKPIINWNRSCKSRKRSMRNMFCSTRKWLYI